MTQFHPLSYLLKVYRCYVAFRFWISLIGVLLFIQSGIAEEDFRTWTSSDGKKLEAKYLRKIGEKIKIVTNRGKEFTVPLSRFSKEDQQYVLDAPTRDSFSLPEQFHDGKKGAVIIASAKGTVEVYDHLLDQKEPAKVGSILESPKTLITGNDGGSVIIFTNGTSAKIGPNTKLFFQKIWQQEFKASPFNVAQIKEETSPCRIAMELKSGELVVDVKKLKKSSSFHIHSPFLAAGIRGTRFGFSATNNYSNLGVLEGEVVVLDAQRKVVELKDKQKVDGAKTGASEVGTMTREQEASVKKSVDSIQRVTREYKISQLEQVMLSQNKQAKDDLSKKENSDGLTYEEKIEKIIKLIKGYNQRKEYHFNLGKWQTRGILKDLSPLIKPISKSSHIKNLVLSGNQITYLSPLKDLENKDQIRMILLEENNVSDLSPIKGFKNLHAIHLQNNPITDLTPLSELPYLNSIYLSGGSGLDIRQLLKFSNLSSLSLEKFSSIQLSHLSSFSSSSLVTLSLRDCEIPKPSALKNLTNLKRLNLTLNNISDLSDLAGLLNLERLTIASENVSDLAPLSRLNKLIYLYLYNTKVTNYSPLRALTNLRELILSKNDVTDIELQFLQKTLPTTKITLQ